MAVSTQVRCPTCGKPASFELTNLYRPFCCERCKILDLGAWADERYKVASSEQEISSVNENENKGEAPSKALPN